MNLVPPMTRMFLESAAAAETCTLAPLGCHDLLLFCGQTKFPTPQPCQALRHAGIHSRLLNQQRAFLFCRLVTCGETETAAPLKSEIGDGRRRLLFRDAVAAMSLFLCSAPLSLSLSLLAVPGLV